MWDLPTRLLHWLLVVGFLGAFLLAEAHGGFQAHVILGLIVALVALLRILWGVIGTTYARFSSFPLRLGALFEYLRGAITRTAPATVHHNPASSYLTFVMLVAALGLAVTGMIMSRGASWAKEAHELLVAVMLGAAALHIVGLAWHAWRHRDGVALSMFHGKKAGTGAEAVESPRTIAAVAFFGLVAAWAGMLVSGLDAESGVVRLPGLGWTIRAHDDRHRERDHHGGERDDDSDHDRDDHHGSD